MKYRLNQTQNPGMGNCIETHINYLLLLADSWLRFKGHVRP